MMRIPAVLCVLSLLLLGCPPPARLEAPAAPGAVAFKITSNPEGAAISVDGAALGNTPVDARLTLGTHQVHATKSGYFALDAPVTVTAGATFHATLTASH